jgi:hypothetical protein
MARYEIKATVTVTMMLPDDFDPNLDGEDILYSLDMFTDEHGRNGTRLFEESLIVNGEYTNISHKRL